MYIIGDNFLKQSIYFDSICITYFMDTKMYQKSESSID